MLTVHHHECPLTACASFDSHCPPLDISQRLPRLVGRKGTLEAKLSRERMDACSHRWLPDTMCEENKKTSYSSDQNQSLVLKIPRPSLGCESPMSSSREGCDTKGRNMHAIRGASMAYKVFDKITAAAPRDPRAFFARSSNFYALLLLLFFFSDLLPLFCN